MVDCRGEQALRRHINHKHLFAERKHEQFVDKAELLFISANCECLA